MKRSNLANLMQRYLTGQVSEQEKKKIEVWLDLKKTEEGTNLVLDERAEEELFRKITANIDNVDEIKHFAQRRSNLHTLFSNRWIQVAASIIILAVSSYTLWFVAVKKDVHQVTTTGEDGKTILEDGTIVWLQEGSQLTYVKRDDVRHATLTGAALFEVAKDASTPFVIACGGMEVKVVGTSFHLESRNGTVELLVLTGKVNFYSTRDKKGMELIADEMAVATANGELRKLTVEENARQEIVASTDYEMEFKNTTLALVLKRIERKFDVQINLHDSAAGRCRLTADFTDHSLQSTMEMINELLEIDFTIDDHHTVTVTGNGCN